MNSLFQRVVQKIRRDSTNAYLGILNLPWYCRFLLQGKASAWNISTHTTKLERLRLYRLALKQPDDAVALEVGSYLGASACFLAEGLSRLPGNAKLLCVDTWHNDTMPEGPRDTYGEFLSNTKPYAGIIIPHRGLSEEVAATIKPDLDLLFIDGDHSYNGCRTDVLCWLPRLKKGGTFVLHDYSYYPEIRKVVRELIDANQIGKGRLVRSVYWAQKL